MTRMNAMFDVRGMLRVRSRLIRQTDLPTDVMCPFYVRKQGEWMKLLLAQMHKSKGHGRSVDILYNEFTKNFHCSALRQTAKSFIAQCITCQKMSKQPQMQAMANLPVRDYMSIQPFTDIALDFAGPYLVRNDKRRSSVKAYILVVVCNQIKAVHLEICVGLETEDFLNAMERITACRGPIRSIHSDNGQTFLRARSIALIQGGDEEEECVEEENEMTTTLESLDWQRIQRESPALGINSWHTSAPYNAPGNGTAESFVKLAKKNLHATFRRADMTLDQLVTAAKRSENVINSRPIGHNRCPQSGTPEIITPNHLIIGRLGASFAPGVDEQQARNVAERWGQVQTIHADFVNRWRQDIVPHLHERKKWSKFYDNVKLGQYVLMIDFTEKRHNWPLAIITRVFPDAQGTVRRVELRAKMNVKGSAKHYERCVRQIVPLDLVAPGPGGEDDEGVDNAQASALVRSAAGTQVNKQDQEQADTPIRGAGSAHT
ncbi:MAG TPA: hypothetical protein EYP93_07335 [Gammaproteobacteria bacterium]|nr:hypothetical protein [Gammaproteobacteria bacterium]